MAEISALRDDIRKLDSSLKVRPEQPEASMMLPQELDEEAPVAVLEARIETIERGVYKQSGALPHNSRNTS